MPIYITNVNKLKLTVKCYQNYFKALKDLQSKTF